MHNIELIPDNTNCIETVARKEYEKLTYGFLRNGRCNKASEAKFELLQNFLEHFDFRKLRKESDSYLQKGQRIKFIIYRERRKIKYRITTI